MKPTSHILDPHPRRCALNESFRYSNSPNDSFSALSSLNDSFGALGDLNDSFGA